MTYKKKILIISISLSLAVVIVVTFITLALTIWKQRPKTTQEWLNDFKNSLVMQKDDSEQKTEKSITITEDGECVALYYQLIEIKNQSDCTVAHLYAKEEFPTLETQEFDTYDDYYLIDGIMYMQRIAAGETNKTSFSSSLDVFWQVVGENLGTVSYNFSEEVFSDLVMEHSGNGHSFSATISDENKYLFFSGAEGISDMSAITVNMTMSNELELQELAINYTYRGGQAVEIRMLKSEPTEIRIKDFVQIYS